MLTVKNFSKPKIFLALAFFAAAAFFSIPFFQAPKSALEGNFGIIQNSLPQGNPFSSQLREKIPGMPADFAEVFSSYSRGQKSAASIPEEYWLQPEWFSGFGERCTLQEKAVENRRVLAGYGAFPSDVKITARAGETIESFFFIHAGCFASAPQGIALNAVFPREAEAFSGAQAKIVQDGAAVSQFFEVSLSPSEFFLSPSHPQYYAGWARRIKMAIAVSPQAPKGVYAIGVDILPPSSEFSKKFESAYNESPENAGFVNVGRPWHLVLVEVDDLIQ